MLPYRIILFVSLVAFLSGCGLYVPDLQENLFASEQERSHFVQAIARNVRCELQDAVVRLYAENPPSIDPENRNLRWFDRWAAQLSLYLSVDEKGVVNPTAVWMPSGIFNLGLGATVSAEAERIDKIGAFFLVSDLKRLQYCRAEERNRGPFILQSNLKLFDWLKATMIAMNNGDLPPPADEKGPLGSNVLSHDVRFTITSSGSVNPIWFLTRASVNDDGTLLSGSRDRTQQLTITFGPTDPNWAAFVIDPTTSMPMIDPTTRRPVTRSVTLAPAAASTAFASDVANSISIGIRNALRR
jgi:hypothetical protein